MREKFKVIEVYDFGDCFYINHHKHPSMDNQLFRDELNAVGLYRIWILTKKQFIFFDYRQKVIGTYPVYRYVGGRWRKYEGTYTKKMKENDFKKFSYELNL